MIIAHRKLTNLLDNFAQIQVNIYSFKVNNRNTRKMCEICSKLITETPERRYWCSPGVFIANFQYTQHLFLVVPLLLWTGKCFPRYFPLFYFPVFWSPLQYLRKCKEDLHLRWRFLLKPAIFAKYFILGPCIQNIFWRITKSFIMPVSIQITDSIDLKWFYSFMTEVPII